MIEDSARLDLDELSALATRPGGELVGVSDASFRIAVGRSEPLKGVKLSPSLEDLVSDLSHEPENGSQWEGVAADGGGRVFVLQEHAGRRRPSHVFALTDSLDGLYAAIALTVADDGASWKEKWLADPNARGEALVLLRDGHVLVIKQKDPVRLIEFGPLGSSARGLGAARFLGADARFEIAPGALAEYEPLESWRFDGPLESINDAAVAGGELYVVSRSSRTIARLAAEVAPCDESVAVAATWALPDAVGEPEGLVLLDRLVPLVADDQPRQEPARDNVFRLEPLT